MAASETCEDTSSVIIIILSVIIVVLCVAFTVILVIIKWKDVSHYRLKQHLKKQSVKLGISPKDYVYDVLIQCAVEDVKWTKENPLQQLEKTYGRKVFFSYRDGLLGKDAVDAIHEDLDNCVNILIVLSNEYVKYEWNEYYVKIAHRKAILQDKRLVFICRDDMLKMEFPDLCKMQEILLLHDIVQWKEEKTPKAELKFWRDLNKMLKVQKKGTLENKQVRKFLRHKKAGLQTTKKTKHMKEGFFYEDPANRKPGLRKEFLRKEVTSEMLYDEIVFENPKCNSQNIAKHDSKHSTKPVCSHSCNLHCFPIEGKPDVALTTVSEVEDTEQEEDSSHLDPGVCYIDDTGYDNSSDSEVELGATPVVEEQLHKTEVSRKDKIDDQMLLASMIEASKESSLSPEMGIEERRNSHTHPSGNVTSTQDRRESPVSDQGVLRDEMYAKNGMSSQAPDQVIVKLGQTDEVNYRLSIA